MGTPLLVEFFTALPQDALQGSLDGPLCRHVEPHKTGQATEARSGGKARRRAAVHIFCKQVRERYTEGTLLRLLAADDVVARRAAVFALGLLGAAVVNEPLAEHL